MRLMMVLALGAALCSPPLWAQSPMDGVDLTSPAMTEAQLTRDEVIARLAADADFTRAWLNGLDLSGLDFTGANLRAARMNGVDLSGAVLDGAELSQAWMMEADLTGASLKGATLFQTQLTRARLAGADLTGARLAADFTKADLTGAVFDNADFSADMKNQSMGLMRGVLRNADADGASFKGAQMMRADMEFASLKGADFTGADLSMATMGGADLTGANVGGVRFMNADVTSARLLNLQGLAPGQLEPAKHLDRAFTD